MVINEVHKFESFVIYGAQVVAYGTYVAIQSLCGGTPESFVVSCLENNPVEIDGIPVRTVDMISRDFLIIVGLTELLQGEVVAFLRAKGFRNLFVLTEQEEHLLMSAYYEKIGRFPLAKSSPQNKPADFLLYEVCNHHDKSLESHPKLQPYEVAIQAGAALTKEKIAQLTDDEGPNISLKNKQYCEMTAAYWIWKNGLHEWIGLEHYRRHLLVQPEVLYDDVDAVLPLPYICYPSTAAQLRRFISEDVFLAMCKALQALHPKEYKSYHKILNGPYQYTYNLVCAKRQVYSDYCSWFFEITEYMEGMTAEVPEIANTRALSYVAEALTNIYFMHNAKGWRLAHVGKEIYV